MGLLVKQIPHKAHPYPPGLLPMQGLVKAVGVKLGLIKWDPARIKPAPLVFCSMNLREPPYHIFGPACVFSRAVLTAATSYRVPYFIKIVYPCTHISFSKQWQMPRLCLRRHPLPATPCPRHPIGQKFGGSTLNRIRSPDPPKA